MRMLSAQKTRQDAGADCIIIGSIASLGCPLYVTARMIDVEKGTIIHSAKMTLNFWSGYEQKLPVFAVECIKKCLSRIFLPAYGRAAFPPMTFTTST